MYDRFKRRIDYLRVSVTDRCNLRCRYCMPAEGVALEQHEDMLSFEQITAIVRTATGLGVTKIRLTGGEPLVRSGIVTLVEQLAAVQGIEKLAMTTNGILLPRYAKELRNAGLTAVNISLDTLDAGRYAELTRGGKVHAAVAGVDAAVAAGFRTIKINTVVGPDTSQEELLALAAFCAERGILLQRIRQYTLTTSKLDDTTYDRPPSCSECNRIRLTANGKLKPCLHSDTEIPVDFADIAGSLERAVAAKPFHGAACTNRSMMQIGG